jgi:U3 small nucleolar RNA-associated protein 19
LLKFTLSESSRKKDIDYLLYQQLLSAVLNHQEAVPGFLDQVVKTLKAHDDVQFIAQKVLSDYLFQLDTATAITTTTVNKNKKLQLVREATSVTVIVKNAYFILSRFDAPLKEAPSNLLHADIFSESKEASLFQFASRRKAFSQVWLGFLRHPLDAATYKEILTSIHVDLLPHLVEPRLLIDFFVQAYDQGGVIALLALNGLFTLITKHNL